MRRFNRIQTSNQATLMALRKHANSLHARFLGRRGLRPGDGTELDGRGLRLRLRPRLLLVKVVGKFVAPHGDVELVPGTGSQEVEAGLVEGLHVRLGETAADAGDVEHAQLVVVEGLLSAVAKLDLQASRDRDGASNGLGRGAGEGVLSSSEALALAAEGDDFRGARARELVDRSPLAALADWRRIASSLNGRIAVAEIENDRAAANKNSKEAALQLRLVSVGVKIGFEERAGRTPGTEELFKGEEARDGTQEVVVAQDASARSDPQTHDLRKSQEKNKNQSAQESKRVKLVMNMKLDTT